MPRGSSSSLPQFEQKCVPRARSRQFQQTSGASADVGTVLIAFSGTPGAGTKKVAGERGCQPLSRPASATPGSVLLRRKRAAAAAIPRRVGILEDKPLAHQRLFVL